MDSFALGFAFGDGFFIEAPAIRFDKFNLVGDKAITRFLIAMLIRPLLLVEKAVDCHPGAFVQAAGGKFREFVVAVDLDPAGLVLAASESHLECRDGDSVRCVKIFGIVSQVSGNDHLIHFLFLLSDFDYWNDCNNWGEDRAAAKPEPASKTLSLPLMN